MELGLWNLSGDYTRIPLFIPRLSSVRPLLKMIGAETPLCNYSMNTANRIPLNEPKHTCQYVGYWPDFNGFHWLQNTRKEKQNIHSESFIWQYSHLTKIVYLFVNMQYAFMSLHFECLLLLFIFTSLGHTS